MSEDQQSIPSAPADDGRTEDPVPRDAPAAGTSQFVVVANRLPVDRVQNDDDSSGWALSPGGLVTALIPVMKDHGGTWVGWVGSADEHIEPFTFDGYGGSSQSGV
ncbi:Hypothetical protein RM25_0975 [Propionibacterium freudenreichii subsp. freudenreichii]|nr:Hypothetical protein RM25_0975 [Propionibacterium freudenreichii subsp. freudenreichii]